MFYNIFMPGMAATIPAFIFRQPSLARGNLMPPASHPRLCTSLTTPSFVVASSVADCRDERIIHEVVGAIHELPYNFAQIARLWAASKIYRENNRFYRLGTRNSLFLVEWVAWTISVVIRRGSGTSAHVAGAENQRPPCHIW